MKTITSLLIVFCSMLSCAQTGNGGGILINQIQQDDTYAAGGTINVNAAIQGDLVIAGAHLSVNDAIAGDLSAAGGEVFLSGSVADDVRIAAGQTTIDSEIGDDLYVSGGEVIITENAVIRGDLICLAGDVNMNGSVAGKLDLKGGDLVINGEIRGASELVGEDIIIGPNARFYKDVEYSSGEGEVDFKDSLVGAKAILNPGLREERSQLSPESFGLGSLALPVFYLLSAFLVILVLHALFRNEFANVVEDLEYGPLKVFGFGLLYLLGVPLIIILTVLIIIGIPLGLFLAILFFFSLLYGHMIASLLLVYYLKHKHGKNWGFWSVTFLALLSAVILQLLTSIPFAGVLLSIVILSFTYGVLTLKVLRSRELLA